MRAFANNNNNQQTQKGWREEVVVVVNGFPILFPFKHFVAAYCVVIISSSSSFLCIFSLRDYYCPFLLLVSFLFVSLSSSHSLSLSHSLSFFSYLFCILLIFRSYITNYLYASRLKIQCGQKNIYRPYFLVFFFFFSFFLSLLTISNEISLSFFKKREEERQRRKWKTKWKDFRALVKSF